MHRVRQSDTISVPPSDHRRVQGKQEAKGLSDTMRQVRGHRLVAIFHGAPLPFLACTTCGPWAAARPMKTSAQCAVSATQAGKAAVRKMARDLHPGTGAPYEGAYYIREGEVDFIAAVQFT